jgi:hypothetical protein
MIDLGGFSMSTGTMTTMVIIFIIYSLVIVGLGLMSSCSPKRLPAITWPPS